MSFYGNAEKLIVEHYEPKANVELVAVEPRLYRVTVSMNGIDDQYVYFQSKRDALILKNRVESGVAGPHG